MIADNDPFDRPEMVTGYEAWYRGPGQRANRLEGIRRRTTLWPFGYPGNLPLRWGGFIGMAVHLRPGAPPSSPAGQRARATNSAGS